jgi:hypothetical protein
LPPYLRKAKSIEELLPWLYLKGISTGDFHEALAALLVPMPQGFPRPRSHGSKRTGGKSMIAGKGAISAPGVSSIFGRMVFIFDPEWLRKNNAFWC